MILKIFFVVLLHRCGSEELARRSYDGAQLWAVEAPDEKLLERLDNFTDVDTWGERSEDGRKFVDVFVLKSAIPELRTFFESEKLNYSTSIEDMQAAIEASNPSPEAIEQFQNRDGRPVTWRAYHRLSDIHKFMDYMEATNRDLVSIKTIGKSSQRRLLKVIVVSNGNPSNKVVWVDSGIHAREWISPAAATYIINELVEEWDELPAYMRSIDWHFLPVTNPDGYEYTHDYDRLWRKSRADTGLAYCKGVDLNRNYGYKWGGKGVSKSPCSEIFGGSGPFSEPETAAIRDYLTGLGKPIAASLSFHSYGQYILYPWGYDAFVPEDHQELARVANEGAAAMRAVSGFSYTVGPAAATLYPASGGSDDWAKGTMKVKYSYTLELRDSGRHGFVLPAAQIIDTSKEAYAFVDVLAKNVATSK